MESRTMKKEEKKKNKNRNREEKNKLMIWTQHHEQPVLQHAGPLSA